MINHFNFKRIDLDQFLITNDFGRYLFLTADEMRRLVLNDFAQDDTLSHKLHSNLFILKPMELYSSEIVNDLRSMKNYVFSSTALHIFVLTTSCNLKCVYCQAQDHQRPDKGKMSIETAHKCVDVALQSPAKKLTFEFQGGEPLLNFPVIKEIIEYTELQNEAKDIEFTLVSNLSLLTEEKLDYLLEHRVNICTSVDGPEFLHDQNRKTINGDGSYSLMERGAKLLRRKSCNFNAIQTTTRCSLSYPREIVREYQKLGAPGIFLRPLTPLGFAKSDWEQIGYDEENWLNFYKTAFDEILKINYEGTVFPEQHAVYFLKKIFHGYALNYMELRSPCGAGVGQLAYYCDGSVYTCDEARMVSEAGDQAFRLGNVYQNDYQEIISSGTCRATCAASVIESIPGCCDCVYQPYCGVCPVINYALDGDIFPRKPKGYRCLVYGGILDFIFSLLRENDESTIKILKSWIEEDNYENSEKE